jgi:hypothetical protein
MKNLNLGILSFSIISLSGCAVFMPPHPNSNFRENETVEIEILTCNQLSTELINLDKNLSLATTYDSIFGSQCQDSYKDEARKEEFAPLAVLASAAVGAAIDFPEKKLAKEATLYEAQWGQEIAKDDFLKIGDMDKQFLKYHGFKICRTV